MLVIVSTLVGLLHPVLSAMSGALRWEGLEHWFFLLGLRLLAMYFASEPWESAQQDIACAWSPGQDEETRRFCTSVCYNRHFLNPVMPTWGFSFLIALLPITIIRMLYPKKDPHAKGGQEVAESATCHRATEHRLAGESHVAARPKRGGQSNRATKSNVAAGARLMGDSNMAANPRLVGATNVAARANTVGVSGVTGSPAGPDMAAQPAWYASVITVCIAVLLATEVRFLWALLAWQLPMVSGPSFPCFPGPLACPSVLQCAVRGQADKHMALVILALTACFSILVCLTYGGVWVALATCCRGRQEGERALEGEHLRCCEGWEERGMGEGRVLRGPWECGECVGDAWMGPTGRRGEGAG
ncbi:uncharacterized protein LOC142072388 [Caretta caretta]|uniref:uncharacterized protein LOC142072388 n=1 Tax=Caretta caretta TaxID=8467 RepID=UPI003F4B2B52